MVACYIDSSFPAMLFFAYKYGEDGPETLLLASANAGGENVARGSLLGALAGARYGENGLPPSLVNGLVRRVELKNEINQFTEAFTRAS
jgi:ADP-ribosyl-[dinitrogen reductase] hydrolase